MENFDHIVEQISYNTNWIKTLIVPKDELINFHAVFYNFNINIVASSRLTNMNQFAPIIMSAKTIIKEDVDFAATRALLTTAYHSQMSEGNLLYKQVLFN